MDKHIPEADFSIITATILHKTVYFCCTTELPAKQWANCK